MMRSAAPDCAAPPRRSSAATRDEYGPRLPFLVISPWAKSNHVDHTLTDQTSVIHFVEDNWLGGQRIGDGSYDALSGPLTGMFNFSRHATRAPRRFLNPNTGEPVNSRSG